MNEFTCQDSHLFTITKCDKVLSNNRDHGVQLTNSRS